MRRYWLVFSQAVNVVLAIYFVVSTLKPDWIGRNAALRSSGIPLIEAPALSLAAAPAGSFRLAAQRASAAVVSIPTDGIDVKPKRPSAALLESAAKMTTTKPVPTKAPEP